MSDNEGLWKVIRVKTDNNRDSSSSKKNNRTCNRKLTVIVNDS